MIDVLSQDEIAGFLPERSALAHKGTFGHLVVVAGSRGFTGAVKLVCTAAYRSGAGLVTAAVPETVQPVVAGALVEAMTLGLPATEADSLAYGALEPLETFAATKSAMVIGPGLSTHPATARLDEVRIVVLNLQRALACPGLNALAAYPERLEPRASALPRAEAVFTPHPGEMSRLTGIAVPAIQEERSEIAAYYAALWQVTVVLKGHGTIIASPDGRARRCPTGNQGMASGGTGDVLAGLIGGLLAQGIPPFEAACAGVYVHGLAGDGAALEKTPRALMASDILEALPHAWRQVERPRS
ncbi:MAG: ADP-dependent (S)-NAD(P)H-hydrate dehydratase [Candidatus Hydrogenedentes bacterium ADurb.Bin179]|nr:MAG: ADP-dependent (S)-NAD(P)H-hydrate dehydratase [Candidatus Hydrogenedentes bacterium ADurb.Bin179]